MKSYPRSFFVLFFTMLTPLVMMEAAFAAGFHIDGRFFRDDQGRSIILRGVNLTNDMKAPPSRGINNPSELDILPNRIRLWIPSMGGFSQPSPSASGEWPEL